MSLPRIVQARVDRASAAARSYINQSATGTAQTINVSQVLNSLGSAKSAVLALPASNPAVAQTVAELDSLRAGVQAATQQATNAIASSADLLVQQFPGAGVVRQLTNLLPGRTAPSEDSAAAPTRPLSSTQATGSAPGAGTLVPDPAGTAATPTSTPVAPPTTSPGVGAPADDGTPGVPNTQNEVQREINTFFGDSPIVPQPNVLDQYASYTYSISLYAITIEAFQKMVNTRTLTLDGKFLLIQSAGAPVLGRNEHFSEDYYIDSLVIESAILGKTVRSAHNVNEFTMTVIEPNGLSLIDNLEKAATAIRGDSSSVRSSYAAANYLLIIRFYGYNDQGELVKVSNPRPNGTTDTNAIVEKFYPVKIEKINLSIENKLVEYQITGSAEQYTTAASAKRGTIPLNMELNGQTVQQILSGSGTETAVDQGQEGRDRGLAPSGPPVDQGREGRHPPVGTAVPPPKATTAPTVVDTQRKGLFEALNQYQKDQVGRGQSIADEYEIEFVGTAIRDAATNLHSPGSVILSATPIAIPTTSREAVLGETSAVNPASRTAAITAGQQIVQVIDSIIRNSTYIKSQQLYTVAEGGPNPGKITPNARSSNLAWFKISFVATPIGFDTLRNSMAYRMKFIVSPYQIYSAPIPYFLPPAFRGVHKEYNWLFTGRNTQVIDVKLTFDDMFAQVMSGNLTKFLASQTANYNHAQTYVVAPRSGESSQGARGATNEGSANLADYLYAPGAMQEIELEIVGDPAWLQQGEVFVANSADEWDFRPFNSDGTINFEAGQVLINFAFNRPVDYDLKTGLLDPGANNFGRDKQRGLPGLARQSGTYAVNTLTSTFAKGRFTQQLKAVLMLYPNPQTAARIAQAPADQLTPQPLSTPQYSPFGPVVQPGPQIVNSPFSVLPTAAAPPPGLVTSSGQIVGGLSGQLGAPQQNFIGSTVEPPSAPVPVTPGISPGTLAAFGPTIASAQPPQQMAAGDDQTQTRFGQPGFVQRAVRSVLSPQRSPLQQRPTLR
jgi:hypothetical protein